MAEIDDVLKVLKDWKEQPKPTVTKVLTYVHDKKHIKGNDVDTKNYLGATIPVVNISGDIQQSL